MEDTRFWLQEGSSGLSFDVPGGAQASSAAQVLIPAYGWPRMGSVGPEEGHAGGRSGCRTAAPAKFKPVKDPGSPTLDIVLPGDEAPPGPAPSLLAGSVDCWWIGSGSGPHPGGLAGSGGKPCHVVSARTRHVTRHSLRRAEHFALTLCASLPASCPLIPPKEGFSSPTPAPRASVPSASGSRVIIYFLPEATPSDFSFDLQTESPK